MKLYDANGNAIIITRYKECMGFVPTLIPIYESAEEEAEAMEYEMADATSCTYLEFAEEVDIIGDNPDPYETWEEGE